ncbi:MAG: DUF362 domain-containing protein [Candidatus Aminicenantes bacterium]|nr:DUF362 domain-containing protein [Candidatus Aminicenantes bacterium]MDH5715269.1 DUF362 domain-containing protein [Candidatus Aminicenantes bacterium]
MKDRDISRRGFLAQLFSGVFALRATKLPLPIRPLTQYLSPRKSQGNLFTRNKKPLLIVVKGNDMSLMLAKGIQALGGAEVLKQKSTSVIIKPNFVAPQPFPVTSDLKMIASLVEFLCKEEMSQISLCEISTISQRGTELNNKFETLGVFEAVNEMGIPLLLGKLDEKDDHIFTFDQRWQRGKEIGIHKFIYHSPFIISTSVLKRHLPGWMSAALKNNFIAYGPHRWEAHQRFREGGEGIRYFDHTIAEFADAIRPELTIIDARSILTKRGPTLGYGAEVRDGVNLLILGGDMVAIDSYCGRIMEQYDDTFEFRMIEPCLSYAESLGLGTADLSKVEIIELET